jgi:hypothetical protein
MPAVSCVTTTARYCGCDGVAHAAECDVYKAGVDLGTACANPNPLVYFACGYLFCDKTKQFCEISNSGFACLDLATYGCPPNDCTCVKVACSGGALGCGFGDAGSSGLTLTCK